MLYRLFLTLFQGQHYAYENPLFRGACAALFCFLLVLFAGPRVVRYLVRLKLGDQPEFDHVRLNELTASKRDVPTMGGVIILGAVLSGTLLFADPMNYYVRMGLTCLVWLGGLGAVDDWLKLTAARRSGSRDGLRMYEKLLFQVGLGVILGFFIYRYGRTNHAIVSAVGIPQTYEAFRVLMVPFYKQGILLGVGAFMLVTVLVVAGTSNAVNLTDGMDGLAAGCVAICSGVCMVLAYIAGDEATAVRLLIPHVPSSGELVVICGSVMGSCLGFLWYNCHPARVFMGDTGSLPLGGVIGYVAIVTRQELMLFLVGGVFVVEAVSVLLQVGYYRLTRGKRLFLMAPIHHHFHLSGWSEPQTVVRFWLLTAVFAVFALVTVKLR